jgi:hypothetical protein
LDFNWTESMDEALAAGKLIVYYVVRDNNDKIVPAFRNEKVRTLADASFVFVVHTIDKDNPLQQEYKVTTAPVWVGLDRYGNPLDWNPRTPNAEEMHAWLNKLAAMAKDRAADIETKSAQAQQLVRKNQAAGIKKLIELANCGRKGYPQIAEAARTLQILADESFARAKILLSESETESEGIAILESVLKNFKGSAPAWQAEIMLAEHLEPSAAWPKLERVANDPKAPPAERDRARQLQTSILNDGLDQIRAILRQAEKDWEGAKSLLRRLKSKYGSTEVGKAADEALADLEEK